MGLTKQYLRYVPGSVFGIIGSGTQIHFITKSSRKDNFIVVPAAEYVNLWNLKNYEKVLSLRCEDVQGIVTAIEPRPPGIDHINHTHVAVGYSSGYLVLYDLHIGHPIRYSGSKGGISTIAWDKGGVRVATASEDGEIVVWNMLTESGMGRYQGHKGRVNKIRFLETRNVLISCGKDLFIKFWDLDANFCFYTLTVPSTKICDFLVIKNDTRLLAGGDGNLTVWNLKFLKEREDKVPGATSETADTVDSKPEPDSKILKVDELNISSPSSDSEEEKNSYLEVTVLGHLARTRSSRICGLASDGRTIAVQESSSIIDRYLILNEEESQAKISRRLKKNRKRLKNENAEIEDEETYLSDEIKKIANIKTTSKVNGLSVITLSNKSEPDSISIAALQADNSILLTTSYFNEKENESKIIGAHKSEIRVIAINLLGDEIITASADSLKVWNRQNLRETKSIECDYPLSLLLPPGDRHILIGTKSGRLQLYDIVSGALLEDLLVHSGNSEEEDKGIWALALTHNGKGFVSGGSDSIVKFWNFELIEDTITGRGKRLSIFQDSKALQVADQITKISCSGCGKFLAVATFDLKETIYYMDSLKLLHEFYGKPMPTTCLDFSSDSSLIVAGSKDCCIRIYATDFGDQKRLLKNCHQGGVTEVKFMTNTHLFFSCGNDGTVKQWDADNFQRIFTLTGHHGIIRCMAISSKGNFVATSGKDRSIRMWEKTNEPLILDDEREEERKRQEEEFLGGTLQTPVVAGETNSDATRQTKISKDTEKAADELYEALLIYEEEINADPNSDKEPNQLMTLVYKTDDPLKFVLLVLRKIKLSELEEAVLILPLNLIKVLIVCAFGFLKRNWDFVLSSRILLIAIRVNMNQIIQSKDSGQLLRDIENIATKRCQINEERKGFSSSGIDHCINRMGKKKENTLYLEAGLNFKEARRKRKKKERIIKRALVSL